MLSFLSLTAYKYSFSARSPLTNRMERLKRFCSELRKKATGAWNLLKFIGKQRKAQQEQLPTLTAEKKMQLERYQVDYKAL